MREQDHKTKDFLQKIEQLIQKGVVKNHAEIVKTLNWNKSVMSSVKNGQLEVPQHIYIRFKEVYSEHFIGQQVNEDWRDEQIDFLKEQNAFLKDQIQAKDVALQEIRNHLKELVSSEKLLAYLQSGLALANTTLDVLLAHRSVMEKKDLRKMKEEADTLHAEYQARLE